MNPKVTQGLLTLSVLLVMGVAGHRFLIGVPDNPMTLEEANGMLHRQVPLGWSRRKLKAWLDSKKLEHHYEDAKNDGFTNATVVDWFTGKPDELGGYSQTMILDTGRVLIGNYDMIMVFYFDKTGKLVDYQCSEISNGP